MLLPRLRQAEGGCVARAHGLGGADGAAIPTTADHWRTGPVGTCDDGDDHWLGYMPSREACIEACDADGYDAMAWDMNRGIAFVSCRTSAAASGQNPIAGAKARTGSSPG